MPRVARRAKPQPSKSLRPAKGSNRSTSASTSTSTKRTPNLPVVVNLPPEPQPAPEAPHENGNGRELVRIDEGDESSRSIASSQPDHQAPVALPESAAPSKPVSVTPPPPLIPFPAEPQPQP